MNVERAFAGRCGSVNEKETGSGADVATSWKVFGGLWPLTLPLVFPEQSGLPGRYWVDRSIKPCRRTLRLSSLRAARDATVDAQYQDTKGTILISLEKIARWQKLKTLVLDSVSSPITKRVYNMALEEFMGWFQQAPRGYSGSDLRIPPSRDFHAHPDSDRPKMVLWDQDLLERTRRLPASVISASHN